MDWQLKPLSRHSSLSGNSFETGEKVFCFIHKDEAGELHRSDLKESEVENFTSSHKILGRWTRIVKEKSEEEKEAKQQTLKSAEDIFIALFDDPTYDDEKETLKQILALFLERKRIIKRLKPTDPNTSTYFHKQSSRNFVVPNSPIEPSQLLKIQEQLQSLVI